MKGRVTLVNRDLGWFAIQQENKDVTVVDGLGDPLPRIDDVVEGNLHSTTREALSNRTTGDALIVRVVGTGQGLAWAGALMQQGRVGMAGVPGRMRASGPRRDTAMKNG
jgi:hypothetical protein